MVAALFSWLAGRLWRRFPALVMRFPAQRAGLLATALAAFAYALLAGFAVPAQRTLYMVLVAVAASFAERRPAAGRTLALALLVVLLLDPWAVLAPGFWLSFVAVAALFFVGGARSEPAGGDGLFGWRRHLRQWGLAQWTATLASVPILLLVFQQFSLVSPLANALAIPVVSFIVTPLALLGAFIPWWPLLVLGHAAMAGLLILLEALATWPVWQVAQAPLWAVLAGALGVAVLLLPRGVPGRAAGLALLLPVLLWPAGRPAEGAVEVTVLDVGQGLASVLRTQSTTLIYDPGPLYSAETDAGQRVVVPFLRVLGETRVDRLIVTHRDADHAGGLASLRAALPVGELVSSMPLAGARPCVAGESWQHDGVRFEFLHPAADAPAEQRSNHLSCVLRVTAGGRRLLLTSDIEAADEAALLARYPGDLAADVLLVPHHGSGTSSTPAFLAAVGAAEAIVPVGYRNRYGHPKGEVLARHVAQGSRLWRTDRQGAITVRLAADGVRIAAWRESHPTYWAGR